MDRFGTFSAIASALQQPLPGAGGSAASGSAPASSAATRVCDDLRRRIIAFDLPPDTVLSRIDLARQYDVSQTPLREALQKLEFEGLIEIFPQSRTIVTRIDAAQIGEAHFLRLAVETEVARRLAAGCDPATLARLRTILTMQEALASAPDELPAFQELDELFHQTLLVGAGQPGLQALLRARTGHLNRFRRLYAPTPEKIAQIIAGHRAIANALAAGDAEAAQSAVRGHLSQTIARLETAQTEHPDYFRP